MVWTRGLNWTVDWVTRKWTSVDHSWKAWRNIINHSWSEWINTGTGGWQLMRMEKRKQLDLSWWKYIRGAVVSLVIIINQGNPTESQLMRMKEWNNLLQLIKMNDREQFDQSWWEWRCWPAGLELMTMSEKRVCHSWWEWMSGNIWSHLRKMNESKADENEWERRTVCYSWWEWMSGSMDHSL